MKSVFVLIVVFLVFVSLSSECATTYYVGWHDW